MKRTSKKSAQDKGSGGSGATVKKTEQTCLLVLGMHRSGTSALTRVLNLAGAGIPKHLLGAGEGNESGHWESNAIIAYNDRLLESIGSNWHDWRGPDFTRLPPGQTGAIGREFRALVRDEFGSAPLIVLKEPRICRFASLVIDALEDGDIDVIPILTVRNPLDVIASLAARKGIWPASYSSLDAGMLWLRHVLDAERATRGRKRAFLSYETLLSDWRRAFDNLERHVGNPFGKNMANVGPLVDEYLSPQLRHHASKLEDVTMQPELRGFISETYLAYKILEADPNDADALADLDAIQESLMRTLPILVQLSETEQSAKRNLSETNNKLSEFSETIEKLSSATVESNEKSVRLERTLLETQDALEAGMTDRDRLSAELAQIRAALGLKEGDNHDAPGLIRQTIDALAEADADRALRFALERQLAEAEDRLTRADAKAEQANQAASRLSEAVALKEAEIADLAAEAETLNRLAAEKQETYEAVIADLKAEVETLNRLAAEKQAAHDAVIADLKAEVETAKRLATEKGDAHAAAMTEANLAKQATTSFGEQLSVKELVVSARERELSKLRKSLTWKLTSPLRAPLEFVRKRQQKSDLALIRASGLFDESWYLEQYPDVKESKVDPALHYLRYGAYEGRWASEYFDSGSYLLNYRDVLETGLNPLMHFLRYGEKEGRNATWKISEPDAQATPLVSIIVPNYNHAAYLEQRLDTIYAQTYRNFEVILLDDCSTDKSREILLKYSQRYNHNTRYIPNEANSGSGYRQWKKGIDQARGDLIWIAESDDWSDRRFLSRLVPEFSDEALTIAYTNSAFMSHDGKKEIWSTDIYLDDIDNAIWKKPFVLTTHQLVRLGWSTKNIIPNVSSAIFRKPIHGHQDQSAAWDGMKICGDWLFYLQIAKGGRVRYFPEKLNYYRVHEASTAKSTFSKDVYYREHEEIANYVIANYEPEMAFVEKLEKQLRHHWQQNRSDFSEIAFDACYSQSRIRKAIGEKKPAILMCAYALIPGGGETFPIFLANMLKQEGFPVTFLSFDQQPRERGIRALLSPDIPVVCNWRDLNQIVNDFGIDIVHSHHAWSEGTIFDMLPEDSRARIVVTMHGMYEALPEKVQNRIIPRLLKRSAHIVHVAQKNLAALDGYEKPVNISFIRNALPNRTIVPIERKSLGIDDDSFVLTVVSRAMREKGWFEAIDATKMLRESFGKKVDLLLIGSGPEEEVLRRQELPSYIHVLGFKGNPRDYYAISDMGMLLSTFPGESYPLTLIDCLSVGKPVIASRIGEIPEMISANDRLAGILVDIQSNTISAENAANKINEIITDKTLYNRLIKATDEIKNKFQPDIMLESYISVYRNTTKIILL